MIEKVIEALHQPEYTGENRCRACTAVNAIIMAVLVTIISKKSKFAAVVTVSILGTLIYLRGYIIPGTPMLTKRYFPSSVLRLFDKKRETSTYDGYRLVETQQETVVNDQPSESVDDDIRSANSAVAESDITQTTEEATDQIVSENFLLDHNIAKPCADVDDICLTESFKNEWDDEINRVNSDTVEAGDAAAAIGLAGGKSGFKIEHRGDARTLRHDDRRIGQWPSQAALVADVTAARVLETWTDEWTSLRVNQKGTLLNGLRLFLETCPTTGGQVTMGKEPVESCCRSHEVVAVTCEDSGERLFEKQI